MAEEKGLPVERREVWMVKVPPGTSSPIVVGKRVYLTAHEGDQRLVDAANGK